MFILLATAPAAGAQVSINNPYSRLGIGWLTENGSPRYAGIGGVSAPVLDAHTLNFQNPATYCFLSETTFQLSGRSQLSRLTAGGETNRFQSGGLNEIGVAFKKSGLPWAIALGLTPYSTVGYQLEEMITVNDSLDARYLISGEGGLNRLLLGYSHGFDLFRDSTSSSSHKLLLGFNLNYLFGSLDQSRRMIYENLNLSNSRVNSSVQFSDFYLDAGLHYTLPLGQGGSRDKKAPGRFLQLGIDFALGNSINARYTALGESFFYFSGSEVPIDTSFQAEDVRGKVDLPSRISAGLNYVTLNREGGALVVSAEYRRQDWQDGAVSPDLRRWITSSFRTFEAVAAGVEWTPQGIDKSTRFYSRITYRAGARLSRGYLDALGRPMEQRGISAGLSLPLIASKSSSRFHLSAEFGSASASGDTPSEDYVSILAGVSLNPFERWFNRRRYD